MIWRLILIDPARRLILPVLLGTLLMAFWGAYRNMEFVIGMTMGLYCALLPVSQAHRRATLFHLALPVPARTLWLSRLVVVGTLVGVPGVLISLVLIATGHGAAEGVQAAARTSMTLCFLLVVWSCIRIERMELPVPWAITSMIASPMLAVLAALTTKWVPLPVFAGVLLAAVLFGWWAYRRIPPSFQAAPEEAKGTAPAAIVKDVTPSRREAKSWSRLALWRSMLGWPQMLFAGVAVLQVLIGNWPLAALYYPMMAGAQWVRISWLYGLPVARRTLFAYTTIPFLLLMLGCFWLHFWVPLVRGPMVEFDPREGVHVPLLAWQRCDTAQAPVIQAPWGESFQPAAERILGFWFFNPYAAGPQSSARFRDWQFERATSAVHGRLIPFQEAYESRVPPGPALLRAALAEQVALILVLFYVQWVGLIAGTISPGRGNMTGGMAAFAMLLPMSPLIFPMLFWSPVVRRGGSVLGPWMASLLPQNEVALILLAVAVAAGAFASSAWLFNRVDLMPRPASELQSRWGTS